MIDNKMYLPFVIYKFTKSVDYFTNKKLTKQLIIIIVIKE